MIKKIISVERYGYDLEDLEAGKYIGSETGGTAPEDWSTELGSQK